MSITEIEAPPGRHRDQAAADRVFLEQLHALEVTAVRLAEERDAALARARRAEAEAAGLLRVNLALQRHLDEYNADRRGYEATIADLRAECARLAAQLAATVNAQPRRRRRWWR